MERTTIAEPTGTRPTITKSVVSFPAEKPKKKILINQYGNRVIKNWCLYVNKKIQRERENAKQEVVVSEITEQDRKTFNKAYRKLMREILENDLPKLKYLKRLASSRRKNPSTIPSKKEKVVQKEGDSYVPCPIDYKSLFRKKVKKPKPKEPEKTKPRVSTPPPMKTKPWRASMPKAKVKQAPLVTMPLLKKRLYVSTVPCISQVKPKFKPKIEYPPLTLRKTPWKPKTSTKPRPKRVRLEKTFYPLPIPTLGKSWHYFKIITPEMHVLRGHTSQYSKKFGFTSNGKQSAFIAVVALVTAQMCPMKFWASEDMDEIISYGDMNFRKNLHRLKKYAVIKPPQIKFKVYLSRAMTYTEIGTKRFRGVFDPQDTNDLQEQIEKLLHEFGSIIFTYCDQSYAIWKIDNAFYILNSEDTDEYGTLVYKAQGGCCAVRSPGSVNQIIDYLAGCLRTFRKCYDIYSFKVHEKYIVDANLPPTHEFRCSQSVSATPNTSKPGSAVPKQADSHVKNAVERQVTVEPEKLQPTGLNAILFEKHPEPKFGVNFKADPDTTHGYLTCEDFFTKSAEDQKRSPFVCSAAIAMLRLCKSSLWKENILKDIFVLGRENFTENVEKVQKEWQSLQNRIQEAAGDDKENQPRESAGSGQTRKSKADPGQTKKSKATDGQKASQARKSKAVDEGQPDSESKPNVEENQLDIPLTETRPVVTLKKQTLEIRSENVVFGKLLKRGQDAISIEEGVILFFKNFDCGVVQGPDTVAIWRESNFFFMFDPNQCDEFDRSLDGTNSCLNWFGNLDDLVKLYMKNIPKEFRNAVFKIAKIEVAEFEKKSDDWQSFKSIGVNKWILRGTTSEDSNSFNVANRNHQSTCISVAALAKTCELGIQSWTPEVIDELIQVGDEFYSGSVMQLQRQEKFVDPNLRVTEIGNELKLNKAVIDLGYEDCVIGGSLRGGDGPNLLEGLETFFKGDDLALLTACGVSLGVFRRNEAFYLFDAHDRDGFGRNLRVNDPIDACLLPGTACIVRFLTLNDLAKHIVSNLDFNDQPVYSISCVEATARSSTFPCLYNFKKFGEEPFAAILHSFGGSHEEREPFKSSVKEKTLCNIIAGLCFAKILNPRHWSSSDVNEILKIGYKILCALAPVLTSNDHENFWKPFEKLQVCSVEMAVSMTSEVIGTFSGQRAFMPPAENSKESIEENVKISELELRTSLTQRRSVTISEGGNSYTSTVIENSNEEFKSLEMILQEIESQKEFFAMLNSTLFELAIFKIERFYFIFDPRESDDNGMMVRPRLEDLMRRIIGRKSYRPNATAPDSKRLTLEEELEELVFGRKVVFTQLKVKPSQHALAAAVESDLLPIVIGEKGSAYTAWFTSIELLKNHIMSKVPFKFQNEKFSLRQFQVAKVISVDEKLAPWNNFAAVAAKHWILRAGLSQNDTQFAQINRNHQDIANCIIALTFAQLCTQTDWNSMVLDVVLKFGDRLHKKSLKKHLQLVKDVPNNLRLRLEQIDLPIFIRPFVISVNDEMFKSDSIMRGADQEPLEAMKNTLLEFFSSSPEAAGVLTSKDYHVAIWKSADQAFLMFDPHEVGPTGVRRSIGFACLQRFTDHKKLVDTFYRSIKELDGLNDYQLTRINVVKNVFVETNEGGDHCRMDIEDQSVLNYSDYNLYTATNGVRSIRAKEVNTITWTKENVSMGICYAVATLCISRSLDPEFYTRDIIDKILVFGNDFAEECGDICLDDFDLCGQRQCPDEINWNFELNKVYTNIQMDIFQRGVVSTYPCPAPQLTKAIEEFFNFHCVGILVTSSFVVAIWRDANEFFIFYSLPVDEVGRISTERDATSCHEPKIQPGLVVFKTVHELSENIRNNIDRSLHCKPFELRICNITMTDLWETPKPCEQQFEKKIDEEMIAPAVAAVDECDGLPEKTSNRPKSISNDFQKLIEQLEKKKRSSQGFVKFNDFGVICGRLSKESRRFNDISRNFQSGAICVVSAAMTCLKDLDCWSGETIDCVVTSGNSLYIESSVANNTREVSMPMLMTLLNFGGFEISVKTESFKIIESENLERESLLSSLCKLFSCYSHGYLRLDTECWAVFKRCKAFFIFDPMGIDFREKKIVQRRAALYKFQSIDAMIEQLIKFLKQEDSQEACEIGAIIACASNDCSHQVELVESKKSKPPMQCKSNAKTNLNHEMMRLKEIEPIGEENEETWTECIMFDEPCAN